MCLISKTYILEKDVVLLFEGERSPFACDHRDSPGSIHPEFCTAASSVGAVLRLEPTAASFKTVL